MRKEVRLKNKTIAAKRAKKLSKEHHRELRRQAKLTATQ
ncbi:hypothetical protein BCF59_0550 [Mycoplasmopsis mustelae]|uniref:Uncharacterized protein n=1 Tax=Mycoplasmopsis mustelae TaxID=171289 RepID=A0A4V3FNW0_9BACT|nr:hypothetical protein BCF59_0550 [Mycoplasmopsis mustelae]